MLGGCSHRHAVSRVHVHSVRCTGLSEGIQADLSVCTGPAGAAPTSGCGVCSRGAPSGLTQVTSRTSCLRRALLPCGPGFRRAESHLDSFTYRGCPNGTPDLGSRPSGSWWLAGWHTGPQSWPQADCCQSTDALYSSLTQLMSLARTDFSLGLYLAKPPTWPYLDLDSDSHGSYITGPPQQTNSGHAGFLNPDQSPRPLVSGSRRASPPSPPSLGHL